MPRPKKKTLYLSQGAKVSLHTIEIRSKLRNPECLEILDATAATNYSLWKATRKIIRPIKSSPSLRKSDNSWTQTDEEKARYI